MAAISLKDFTIIPGYDSEWGVKNFLDDKGCPIAGIYSDVENDDYHAIPAISSSMVKKFKQSPKHYKRSYLAKVIRNKTTSTQRSLDCGTVTHGLVLEPERTTGLWWYHINAVDYPDALDTTDQIKAAITALGEKPKGARKDDLIAQLLALDPTAKVLDDMDRKHIMGWLLTKDLPWLKVDRSKYPDGLETVEQITDAIVQAGNTPAAGADLFTLAGQLKALKPELAILPLLDREWQSTVHQTDEYKSYVSTWVLDPVLYDDANRAYKSVQENEFARALLSDGVAELTIIAKDPKTGLWLKAKFDWLRYDLIAVDLKTTRDTHPDSWAYQAKDLGYDIQEAFYTYVASLAGIQIKSFPFVVVEFADIDNCEVYEIGPGRRGKAKIELRDLLDGMEQCLSTDKWYGYSKQSGVSAVLEW